MPDKEQRNKFGDLITGNNETPNKPEKPTQAPVNLGDTTKKK